MIEWDDNVNAVITWEENRRLAWNLGSYAGGGNELSSGFLSIWTKEDSEKSKKLTASRLN